MLILIMIHLNITKLNLEFVPKDYTIVIIQEKMGKKAEWKYKIAS